MWRRHWGGEMKDSFRQKGLSELTSSIVVILASNSFNHEIDTNCNTNLYLPLSFALFRMVQRTTSDRSVVCY